MGPKPFRCSACGMCCKRPWTIEIGAYDIIRWFEEGRVDIIAQLVPISGRVARLYGVPFIFTFPRRESGECIFLDRHGKCTIHDIKPLACRAYPLQLGDNFEAYFDTFCPNVSPGTVPTKEMLDALRLHIASIEALKREDVRRTLLEIVEKAKREYLERIGCMKLIENLKDNSVVAVSDEYRTKALETLKKVRESDAVLYLIKEGRCVAVACKGSLEKAIEKGVFIICNV